MIAFLVKTYPKLSETFVHGELVGLERAGVALALYALARPDEPVAPDRGLRAPLRYVPDPSTGRGTRVRLALARLASILRAPRRHKAVRDFARRHHGVRADALLDRAAWLAQSLARRRVRHLHVHFASQPADVAELAARLAGIGYSLSAHAKDIYLEPPGALARKLAGARFTVTCTDYNRRFLSGLAPAATVRRMYHGIDLARLRRTPDSGGGTDAPLILAVGRLREKKGFATLVDACAILQAIGVQFRCEIVGYGPDGEAIAERIARAGLAATVTLVGRLPHAGVIERYRGASVFVLPCQLAADGDRDGIPNVLLEAMAMSLPVLTTDVSGIPEVVVHEQNGLVVAPGDPLGLAREVARVLGDAALAGRLGLAARATVERGFDNDRNLEVVRELLAVAASAPALAPDGPDALETIHVA